ncbi:NAD(P)H-binding protein [Neobacillus cucumis]|uniref:Oxidoreductase n=1 Tax=Neobacillus cucumis TaxID=1740721 RepID=A0A2N5HSR6_9BACI|nr:NAD(P)H-binding protein [Neobacillus cucumis]PLS08562.1 oxidoreductase [Neobacillus cucumis]
MAVRKNKALILGASGLVGKELVKILVQQKRYEKIILLVRRPIEIKESVLELHTVDFNHLGNYSELFNNVTDVYCCLGTTIKKAKTREAFRKVDYVYPLEAAKVAKSRGVENFLIITAMGANPKSSFFYNRVKGEIEESLTMVFLPAINIFRPSLLLGEREEFRFGERLAANVSGFLNKLMVGPLRPYRAIEAKKVAAAMAAVASTPKKGVHIYSSQEIELWAQGKK